MTLDYHSQQFATLFDFLDDVLVWVKDQKGRYCWVNRAFLLNYSLERLQIGGTADLQNLLGKTDYDLSPPFLADQFRLDDDEVLSGKRIVSRIEMVRQPDGTTRCNVTNKIPLREPDGKIVGTAGISHQLKDRPHQATMDSEFRSVLTYLRDHYADSITNTQLASLEHMSLRAFERKFSKTFHLTPQKYLRKVRLLIASRALIYSPASLAEVAQSCGFADQSHFTREFHRMFGRTPRDYRQHYLSEPRCAVPSPKSDVPAQSRPGTLGHA